MHPAPGQRGPPPLPPYLQPSSYSGLQRTPPEIREELRRRLYLAALLLGLAVLLALWLLETPTSGARLAMLTYPLLILVCLWGLYWVYTRRPLRLLERGLYAANTLAVLGQFASTSSGFSGDVPLQIASTHLLLIANAILGYLIFSIRRAAWLSVGSFALGVGVSTLALWQRGEPALGLVATRLHVSTSTLLLLVYALAWYRTSFLQMYDERALLERQALTDPLTGLPNRHATYAAIEQMLEQSRAGQPGSVVLFDVDHFKRINDTHGHPTGDRVLIDLATTLRQHLREQWGESGTPGRWGGEEFILVLPGLTLAEATALAGSLQFLLLSQAHPAVGVVTASFGVSAAEPGDDLRRLTARADHALYAAKAGGRNRVVTHPGEAGAAGLTPQELMDA
ncbi:GGDEF domain-containing protein [Deinococcus koreensis]|nr:GGDEF domain-containing protein [Deinococcus koreensis]